MNVRRSPSIAVDQCRKAVTIKECSHSAESTSRNCHLGSGRRAPPSGKKSRAHPVDQRLDLSQAAYQARSQRQRRRARRGAPENAPLVLTTLARDQIAELRMALGLQATTLNNLLPNSSQVQALA